MAPENERAAIGRRLQSARHQSGLSQGRLAKLMGVTPPSVSSWERGVTAPTIRHLIAFARAVGASLDELTGVATAAKGDR